MPRDPLEPAYRLIASNRYTEAIHLINKLLKKQPNFQIAKVWKCEALYGLGNVAESEEVMSTIIDGAAADKRTLECIADFYRARGNYSKLVQVYEDALKVDPNDESWRKALFECCGLAGDYKKQQQQALLLYKQTPRMLFYCMAVVCLLQQSDENPVALELAVRMMVKQADANKLKSKNEILLYLTVLEKAKKYEEALSVVEKSSMELDTLISTVDKKIELYILLERWQDAIVLLKQCIDRKPDSWIHYKTYLKTVLQFNSAGGAPDNAFVEDSAERANLFLKVQHEKHPNLRGPLLAQMELCKLQSERGDSQVCQDLSALMIHYFNTFGEKGISLFDLSLYIKLLTESQAFTLLHQLSESTWPDVNLVELQRKMAGAKHVTFVLLSRMLRAHEGLSVQQMTQLVSNLALCYENSGEERNDHYLTLLSNIKLSLYDKTGDGGHLIDAVCAIEEALSRGPGIFALQVMLLQLYFALGGTKAAKKLYETLRIQSVQVDTLAHMFLLGISSTGHFSVAMDMWETALKILHQCAAESLEALVWSYRSGIFHRVDELTRCARRLQRSLTVPWVKTEKLFLELVLAEPSRSEQVLGRGRTQVDWDSCLDSRDLQALPSWDPPGQEASSTAKSYHELLIFGKLREATLNSISSAVTFGKSRTETDRTLFFSSLEELRSLYSDASVQNGVEDNVASTKTYTRLHLVVERPLPTLLGKLLDSEQSSFEEVCALLNQMSEDSVEIMKNTKTTDVRKCLEISVTQIEVLSLATLVTGAARAGLTTIQRRRIEPVVSCLQNCWTQLEGCLNFSVPSSSYPDGVIRETVETKLRENYQAAIDDLKKIVRKKASYLHKLKSP